MPKPPKVVLLIESSRASGRELLRGIAHYTRLHGHWSFYWEPAGLESAWPRLKTFDADGIILRDVDKIDEVAAFGVPAVVVAHRRMEVPGMINVVTDSPGIGVMAAEHLMQCGYSHFAFCGVDNTPWSKLRETHFSETLKQAGYSVEVYATDPKSVFRSSTYERQCMAEWLLALPKPIGLLACNDDRGQQVMEACKTAGLHVPDEVAVLGVDNDELICELSDPPMSSVAVNFERAGFESAMLLDHWMRGKKIAKKNILVQPTHVVSRQSTNVLFVDYPAIARALRFIRDRCRMAIHVMDVVQAANLSRRVLEKRFQNVLGRSINREIRRVRVEQICRLLVETNLPVSQIALSLQFGVVEHFARYFREEKKMTPLAYRKQFGKR